MLLSTVSALVIALSTLTMVAGLVSRCSLPILAKVSRTMTSWRSVRPSSLSEGSRA